MKNSPAQTKVTISLESLLDSPDREGVVFVDCDFSGAELGALRLVDCRFEGCNLSNTRWRGAALNDVAFVDTKLLGADLSGARRTFLGVSFEGCVLDYVDVRTLPLAKTQFVRCTLREAFFGGANLSGASFSGSDLSGATFGGTNLTGADFRGAAGVVLDPDTNTVTRARFDNDALAGLLTKYRLDID